MGAEFDLVPRGKNGRIRPLALNWLLRIAFAGVALFLSGHWLIRWLPQYLPRDWANAHERDALIDWKAARLFLDGVSMYSPEGLKALNVPAAGHPPTTPFWFLPLATFDKALAAEIIGLSVWFCLVIHLYLCARAVKFPAPATLTLLVWSGFITTEGFLMHFWAVQLSEHIALAYVLAWWFLRRRQDTRAGILLGIAGTLKLFPGLMFIFLLFARRWRAFIAASLTFLLVAAAMTSVYGLEGWKLFFTQQGPISEKYLGSERNASLHGIVVRLFMPLCSGPAVSSRATTMVIAVIALALIAGAVFLSWQRLEQARNRDPEAIDLPFALFSVLSAFLNPWIWEHYTVLLIQPAFVVAATLLFAFRHTLRAWLDERASHWTLGREALCLLLGVASLVAIATMLGVNWSEKSGMLALWRETGNPWYHRRFHWLEALNYLPWVIAVFACYLCFIPRPARARASTAATAAPVEPAAGLIPDAD